MADLRSEDRFFESRPDVRLHIYSGIRMHTHKTTYADSTILFEKFSLIYTVLFKIP